MVKSTDLFDPDKHLPFICTKNVHGTSVDASSVTVQVRVPFRPLRFTNGLFLLFENLFRYRSRFCKMLNFPWFFFGLPIIGCQKVLMYPNLHGKKH